MAEKRKSGILVKHRGQSKGTVKASPEKPGYWIATATGREDKEHKTLSKAVKYLKTLRPLKEDAPVNNATSLGMAGLGGVNGLPGGKKQVLKKLFRRKSFKDFCK